jgi:hypothetical protein
MASAKFWACVRLGLGYARKCHAKSKAFAIYQSLLMATQQWKRWKQNTNAKDA